MTTAMATRILVLVTLLFGVLGAGLERKNEMLIELDQHNEQVLGRPSTHTSHSSPRKRTRYDNYYPSYNQQSSSPSPVAVANSPSSASPSSTPSSSSPSMSTSPSPSMPTSTPSSMPTSTPSSVPTSSPSASPPLIEEDGFVIQESTVRFFRLSGVGVSVTRGASASLSFDLTISAVHASVLAAMDAPFRSTLVGEEVAQYESLVSEYEESLDIPFMEFLNGNLASDVSLSDLRDGCDRVENCPAKTRAGRMILENQGPTRVRLTGEIFGSGTSAIPTTVFPLFRAADVVLSNGIRVIIVSSNPSDVVVGTEDGTILSSGAESFTVREE